MSLQLIQQYHARLERLSQYGGSRNESSIRGAFGWLLIAQSMAEGVPILTDDRAFRDYGVALA